MLLYNITVRCDEECNVNNNSIINWLIIPLHNKYIVVKILVVIASKVLKFSRLFSQDQDFIFAHEQAWDQDYGLED